MTLVMMRTTIRLYEVDNEGKIPHNVVREQFDTPGVGLECRLAPKTSLRSLLEPCGRIVSRFCIVGY